MLKEAIVQATEASKPQVIFKVTEADVQTCVPHVSLYKLGKLTAVEQAVSGACQVKLCLRDDFKFDDDEEAQMLELLGAMTLSAFKGSNGYQGAGVYAMPLADFAECYIEVQQPGLRARIINLLDTQDTFSSAKVKASNTSSGKP